MEERGEGPRGVFVWGQVSWICSEALRDVPSFNLDFKDFNVDIGVVEIERVGEKRRREVKR